MRHEEAREALAQRSAAVAGVQRNEGENIHSFEGRSPEEVCRALLAGNVELEDMDGAIGSIGAAAENMTNEMAAGVLQSAEITAVGDDGHLLRLDGDAFQTLAGNLHVAMTQIALYGRLLGREPETPAVAASVIVPALERIATSDRPREAALELMAEIGRGLR